MKFREYKLEVRKYWYIIILITTIIFSFMLWRALTTPPTYQAELTFMLNENDNNGGISGVSAILGQFGFGRGKGGYNLSKIFQLAKSRKITQEALFEKVEINNRSDYLANHIIDIYRYHEKWEKDTSGLQEFHFSHDIIETFNLTEKEVFKEIYQKVVGHKESPGLIDSSIDSETGILTLISITENESLSIILVKNICNKLSNYYVNKSVERQQLTHNIIKGKTDSLERAINIAQSRLLKFQDSNKGLSMLRYEAEKIRLQQEIQKLIIAYGESYKQLEIADFTLRNSTPIVQIIDLPIEPIKPKHKSILVAIIVSLFAGSFIGTAYIVLRKTLRDILE